MSNTEEFLISDRVVVSNSKLTTNGKTGVVTKIKPNGLVVVRFDDLGSEKCNRHNAYRPVNLKKVKTGAEPKTKSGSDVDAPSKTNPSFYRKTNFVCALYDGGELIYMLTANTEEEATRAAVLYFKEYDIGTPGIKVIKAPEDHRWNSASYKCQVTEVRPSMIHTYTYKLLKVNPGNVSDVSQIPSVDSDVDEPACDTRVVWVTINGNPIKFHSSPRNVFGYALQACHLYQQLQNAPLTSGSTIEVGDIVFKVGSGRRHDPLCGCFQIDATHYLYRDNWNG